MKRTALIILSFALWVSAMVSSAYGEDFGDFGDLEGVIVLSPEGDNSAPAEQEEGLVLEVQDYRIEPVSDTYCAIILNTALMNWEMSSFNISDSVESVLVYEDEYTFPGTIDFGDITQINMLENITGTITFVVPNIVALADNDVVMIEMNIAEESYEEEIDLQSASSALRDEINVPFEYDLRETDELEIDLGEVYVADSFNGGTDERYKWVIQEISVINWAESALNVGDAVQALLAYKDKYGFEAQFDFPQEQLGPLEMIHGIMVFHVPLIVTEADDTSVELQITLQDDSWSEAYKMKNAKLVEAWEDKELNLKGYKKLDYIEGTGTQYIDTGWKDEDGIIVEYRATWELNASSRYDGYMVGSHNVSSPYGRNGGYWHNGSWELGYGDNYPHSTDLPFSGGEIYDVVFCTVSGNGYLEVNGKRLISDTSEQTVSEGNVLIFANNVQGDRTSGKLYYATIYDHNGNIARDYVPCLRLSDHAAGLYDKVSKQFYPNAGEDDFVIPDEGTNS